MRIDLDVGRADIEPAANWISGLIGAAVDKRVAAFEQQERANPILTMHYRDIFNLEFALAAARKYRKLTGRLPRGDDYLPLYSFIVPAFRIHAALPSESKKPFEGRLLDAVNGRFGARPFAYEITNAVHLMRQGWDVDFVDYSGAARFDLLGRLGKVEIEVECKTTSGDTGRKIHRQEANRLSQLLLPITQELANTQGCHRIRVTIPDRLGKSNSELAAIVETVAKAVQQEGSASNDHARAAYAFDGLDPWPDPEIDPDGVVAFFEHRFGRQNATLFFNGRRGFSIVAVMLLSSKADSVVETIAEEAKKAAAQCSGKRPAVIALHLVSDVSDSDLENMLKRFNGMHKIIDDVLRGGKRRHVDTVAFTFPASRRTDGRGAIWLSGRVSALYNPAPAFNCPEIRKLFRSNR